MEFEEEQIWSKDLYLAAGYRNWEDFGVSLFGKCEYILCCKGENHIILDNRILGSVYMGRWVMWIMSDQRDCFVREGGVPPNSHSFFLAASTISSGHSLGAYNLGGMINGASGRTPAAETKEAPWRPHLPDSSSNLCNGAKVSACCLKYVSEGDSVFWNF